MYKIEAERVSSSKLNGEGTSKSQIRFRPAKRPALEISDNEAHDDDTHLPAPIELLSNASLGTLETSSARAAQKSLLFVPFMIILSWRLKYSQ